MPATVTGPILLHLFGLFLVAHGVAGQSAAESPPIPEVRDPRLELTLLASEPEIVTPTSLAVDAQGRLYAAVTHTHSRTTEYAGAAQSPLGWHVDQELIRSVLADPRHPPAVKAMAVRYVVAGKNATAIQLLSELAQSEDSQLASEAIRQLAAEPHETAMPLLAALARQRQRPAELRCEAIMALAGAAERQTEVLLPLLEDTSTAVALAAARALTPAVHEPSIRDAFHSKLQSSGNAQLPKELADQLQFALQLDAASRPQSDDDWRRLVELGGSTSAGRRVFFDRRVGCGQCHTIEGRGSRIGPNLTHIAAAKSRDEILASILHPSREKSPDFQGYFVELRDGRTFRGAQFHFRGESAELLLPDGQLLRFRLQDAVDYRPLDESLMPEGLAGTMSLGEFRDLLAFLCALK